MNIPLSEGSPLSNSTPPQRPRTTAAAWVSLILGILALPFNLLAGLPALLVGYRTLYSINASEGRLLGRGLTIIGMILGGLGCLEGIGWGLLLLFGVLESYNAQADCANNQRQIGQGLQQYQLSHQETFPPATIPNPMLKPEERLSWLVALLPYLNRKAAPRTTNWQTLVDSIDPKLDWENPAHQWARSSNINLFLCRGYPDNADRAIPGLTDYVGFAGVGRDAASLPRDDVRAGFFGYDRTVTLSQLKRKGLAETLIVTETTQNNGPWIAGGPPTIRSIFVEDAPLIGRDRPFGGCHFNFRGQPGLNTLWLDGSVRYLAGSMPAQLLAEHAQINVPAEK